MMQLSLFGGLIILSMISDPGFRASKGELCRPGVKLFLISNDNWISDRMTRCPTEMVLSVQSELIELDNER